MVCSDVWVRKGSDTLNLDLKVTPVSTVLSYAVALRQFDREEVDPPRGRTFKPAELKNGVLWPLGKHHVTSWFLTVVTDTPGKTGKVHVTIQLGGKTVFDQDCGQPGDGLDGDWRVTTWSPA